MSAGKWISMEEMKKIHPPKSEEPTPKKVFLRFQMIALKGSARMVLRPYATMKIPENARPGKYIEFIELVEHKAKCDELYMRWQSIAEENMDLRLEISALKQLFSLVLQRHGDRYEITENVIKAFPHASIRINKNHMTRTVVIEGVDR